MRPRTVEQVLAEAFASTPGAAPAGVPRVPGRAGVPKQRYLQLEQQPEPRAGGTVWSSARGGARGIADTEVAIDEGGTAIAPPH